MTIQGPKNLKLLTMWELNPSTQEPQNPGLFIETLKALESNPQWINEHAEDARPIFSLLEKTNIPTNSSYAKTAYAIYQSFLKNYIFNVMMMLKQILSMMQY